MKNFVISLNSALDRRAHIVTQFTQNNLNFEFFDAIQPPQVIELANNLHVSINDTKLSGGEIGCLLSHVSLWKKVIDENIDFAAIFEDDIYLSKDAHYFLNNSQWIVDGVDFIKIEKVVDSTLLSLSKFNVMDGQYQLAKLKTSHLGTGGYIISKEVAHSLLHYITELEELEHIDQIMFKFYFSRQEYPIYQLNPVLCIQDCILNPNNQNFDSTLQWREKIQIKQKKSVGAKFKREFIRIFSQLIEIPFRVRLNIKL